MENGKMVVVVAKWLQCRFSGSSSGGGGGGGGGSVGSRK